MAALLNKRHEAFAQALAKGKNATQAYVVSGYAPCRQNASRLASNDDIKQRIAELKEQRETDTTDNRNGTNGQFLQGKSGNPVGRPKGSRNKLGEQFLSDLRAEWEVSGAEALKRVAANDPTAFVRTVASILPREIDQTINIDSELFREVRDFRAAWALARQHIGADDDKLIEHRPIDDAEPIDG